jgi:hypothetical protein
MDIIIELALFSTSIYLVKKLQLSFQKKLLVVLAFGLRLPYVKYIFQYLIYLPTLQNRMIAPAVLRLDSILAVIHSSDPTLEATMVGVYTQMELCYSILAATTPCLRPFMKTLNTNYGAPASMKSTPDTTHAYSMNSISNRSRTTGRQLSSKGKQPSISESRPITRWDKTAHHASVMSGDQVSLHSHDSKKMIISKNIEWAVDFDEEQGRGP